MIFVKVGWPQETLPGAPLLIARLGVLRLMKVNKNLFDSFLFLSLVKKGDNISYGVQLLKTVAERLKTNSEISRIKF